MTGRERMIQAMHLEETGLTLILSSPKNRHS